MPVHNGTRCSRIACVRWAGMIHTPPSRSISVQTTPWTSPERVGVSTGNREGQLQTGCALDGGTISIADATSVRQRPHVAHDIPLRSEGRTDPVGHGLSGRRSIANGCPARWMLPR